MPPTAKCIGGATLNSRAMAAFRTLWTALVGLYEETLVLLGGNLLAVALNVPIGVLLVLPFTVSDQSYLPWLVSASLIVLMPTPGNLALAGLTQVAAGPEIPRLGLFTQTLRARWRLGLVCSVVSVAILAALIWNIAFYLSFGQMWSLFISIIWLYATLFWLSLHIYLVPLAVHVAEPRIFDLYRRAAVVALGHAGYTFVLLVLLLIVACAAVVFLPVYVLVGQAFVSLAQAQALREVRRRHGDLPIEAEEEVSRL